MADLIDVEAYREQFVWPDAADTYPYFACNVCGLDVGDVPCPEHAPTMIPGLRLVDCTAGPRHLLWAHDRDDYGYPCPMCVVVQHNAEQSERDRCRHWPWRSWTVTKRAAGWAYTLGAISGYSVGTVNGCNWCVQSTIGLRGQRPYVLGVSRETWRCWFRGHRRGEHVGFGFCGKCQPWPCCGSELQAHVSGCREDA